MMPHSKNNIKLLITDMDSTLIGQETIDEIAQLLGIKAQVATITEQAMQGKLDFSEALRQRVALIAGVAEADLRQVYEQQLHVNVGVKAVLALAKTKGICTAVVSGGFSHFTQWIAEDLGIDFQRANVLEVIDGKLTGQLLGDIIDAAAKRHYLWQLCQQLHITPKQVLAVGDGANDLLMLQAAGIGVAYHAKTIVREQCQYRIDTGDWRDLRQWL